MSYTCLLYTSDKIAGVFVPTVITIALIAGVIWLISGATFEFAMSTAIAVLVISCPCALGLDVYKRQ